VMDHKISEDMSLLKQKLAASWIIIKHGMSCYSVFLSLTNVQLFKRNYDE
jgi:hypothetical protein